MENIIWTYLNFHGMNPSYPWIGILIFLSGTKSSKLKDTTYDPSHKRRRKGRSLYAARPSDCVWANWTGIRRGSCLFAGEAC